MSIDTGKIKVWSVKGQCHVPLTKRYKKSEALESYTITGLTSLDVEGGFVWSIIKGGSNGDHYRHFMTSVCMPCLQKDDVILVDNMNFHVTGWSAEVVVTIFQELGVKYYRLPVYSPEFNPIELVWAWMKSELRKFPLECCLEKAIVEVLNRITTDFIIACYHKCGYLV